MGVVSTILRLVGGFVGQRVGSSLGTRLERSLFGGSEKSKAAEGEGKSDESEDESTSDGEGEGESDEDTAETGDESDGPPVIERVTEALDSVTEDSDDAEDTLGDLDGMSNEELRELADTLVDELNRRSE